MIKIRNETFTTRQLWLALLGIPGYLVIILGLILAVPVFLLFILVLILTVPFFLIVICYGLLKGFFSWILSKVST